MLNLPPDYTPTPADIRFLRRYIRQVEVRLQETTTLGLQAFALAVNFQRWEHAATLAGYLTQLETVYTTIQAAESQLSELSRFEDTRK